MSQKIEFFRSICACHDGTKETADKKAHRPKSGNFHTLKTKIMIDVVTRGSNDVARECTLKVGP
jgi:hypothetical protein